MNSTMLHSRLLTFSHKHRSFKNAPSNLLPTILLLFIIITVCNCEISQYNPNKISIRTPNIRPDHGEQYICVSYRLPMGNIGDYIVGFNPQGSAERIHHMLLYGCDWPGRFVRDTPNAAWDCGEMMSSDAKLNSTFPKGKICEGSQHILYAWAKDAPALKLPDKVGFKIGGVTSIHYLVLQVHYAHVHAFEQDPNLYDHSGLDLDIRLDDGKSGIDKRAGVLLLASSGFVDQGISNHYISCRIQENIKMHLIKYRVHTHKLGTEVAGYKFESDAGFFQNNNLRKTLIGKESPQKPQMFYDVLSSNMTLQQGDIVFAQCTFNNNKGIKVDIGATGDDEMCNFYIMYWTDTYELLKQDTCVRNNPQLFSPFLL